MADNSDDGVPYVGFVPNTPEDLRWSDEEEHCGAEYPQTAKT